MSLPLYSEEQVLRFYRAALAVASRVDAESDQHTLDAGADAAWRAYGADLPPAVRCDLVLRNFAMLYPAAFAPGPAFGLSGWSEDDPWGGSFRPAPAVVGALFSSRPRPSSAADALEHALAAWGLAPSPPFASLPAPPAALADRLSLSTNLVVTGARAAAAVARAFVGGERLTVRAQVALVSDRPDARHAIGLAAALLREQGTPALVSPSRSPDEDADAWARREKQRLGIAQAHLLVTSADASAAELTAGRALAAALGAAETIEIGET